MSTSTKHLRLGTRRSALAWVQSSQVAAALRAAHPGLSVELVGIDTRGDKVLDVPLSAIEGKEFFTAEIDHALRDGRVDFTVHSLKDLSLERPPDFALAAIPARANPRDIAIFAADVPGRLAAGAGLRIGTSSPRRNQLLPAFLARALPHASRNTIELVNLRGNVDTRLRRLREPRGSALHLDGLVLASAGLSRLFADDTTERQGHALLSGLLEGLPFMLLPLTDSPGAPGQGALAIECRSADADTRALLAVLEDPATRGAITLEREVLARHGGGCHQRFGATVTWLAGLGGLLQVGGLGSQGHDISERRFLPEVALPPLPAAVRPWDGSQVGAPVVRPAVTAAQLAAALDREAVFIAHWRALPEGGAAALAGRRVWCSGHKSWFELARQGVWVEGCGESLGAESAAGLLAEPLFRLPPLARWAVLTHEGAESSWQQDSWRGAQVYGTYGLVDAGLPEAEGLAGATHIWWHSAAQFERLHHRAARGAHHASGMGKTAGHIRKAGIASFNAFPSVTEWRQWAAPGH